MIIKQRNDLVGIKGFVRQNSSYNHGNRSCMYAEASSLRQNNREINKPACLFSELDHSWTPQHICHSSLIKWAKTDPRQVEKDDKDYELPALSLAQRPKKMSADCTIVSSVLPYPAVNVRWKVTWGDPCTCGGNFSSAGKKRVTNTHVQLFLQEVDTVEAGSYTSKNVWFSIFSMIIYIWQELFLKEHRL